MNKILHAFYDLAVSPTCYDFMQFLQLAELHRIRYGFDEFILYYVPGPNHGFRDDNLPSPINERQSMFRNINMPAGHLFNSCKSILWLHNRKALQYNIRFNTTEVFPLGYQLNKPRSQYMSQAVQEAFIRGEKLQNFQPAHEYAHFVDDLIENIACKRKIITINLRENPDYLSRNSNLKAWDEFCRSLDETKYFPIIIRETANIHKEREYFRNFHHSELASVNLLYRCALYNKAYINMFVNNGPAICALYSSSSSITVKLCTPDDVATTKEWFAGVYGMRPGDQMPHYTKAHELNWDNDDLKNIMDSFLSMNDRMENHPEKLREVWGCKDEEQLLLFMRNIYCHVLREFQYGVYGEQLSTLAIMKDKYKMRFDLKNDLKEMYGEGYKNILDNIDRSSQIEIGAHVVD